MPRGFHLITQRIIDALPELRSFSIGILHLFICHTSASLTLNEYASKEVRLDMEATFSQLIPENPSFYTHGEEGPDDMPAHLKASILGCSLILPISGGRVNLGTWQGIFLCEHRNNGGERKIIATVLGGSV